MAAVMDLDLNCSPPSPEPAAQEDLRRSMLRQEHAFRDQVQNLHRLYWTQKNLADMPPFWKQSNGVLYAHHPPHYSHTMDSDVRENPGVLSHCYERGKQARRCHDEGTEENLDVKGSVGKKTDNCSVQGRPGYRCLIDLEKPATLDDDVEIVSPPGFISYASQNGGSSDKSQCVWVQSSPLVFSHLRGDQTIPHVSSGSTGSSDTPDSHSPAKAKTTESGRMFFDLNVAQEDDLNICPHPSKDFCNNSNKIFHKGSESSVGSSKGSSITAVMTISAPDNSREEMAAGLFRDSQSHRPFCVEASKYNALLRGNIQHQHALDKISGLDAQDCMVIPRKALSVSSNGGNNSLSGLPELGDRQATNLMGQPAVVLHKESQEETITVISDDEMEGIDLNVSIESIDLPSKVSNNYIGQPIYKDGSEENSSSRYFRQIEGQQSIPFVECPTIKNHHMAESKDCKNVQSPVSGIAIRRSVLIPETPQGRDYACPMLRLSNNGASVPLDTVSNHQAELEEDEKSATTAAETLLSIFANNSAWMTDSHGSNSQTDAQVGIHQPQPSLNSFEESILNLEEIKDDVESIPVRPPDKEGPSCGIKLKRGRGLRDFQREILPGLVSLARHEICDDLHSIGYELRKTRSRRTSGDQYPHATRKRLPRRCSAAWNE
ncbi:uncharacterized protein LOC133911341 isoform X2 [Phragmites australis]|uniref:uncharacterized protein LOC133911341 isoform X2 n=1 Tax=Phragmites australis TaxID=29695 RepID=UPI002D77D65E|nr:uncharacterized protein LOC133911341 isoform X2 [Phragmites australis]